MMMSDCGGTGMMIGMEVVWLLGPNLCCGRHDQDAISSQPDEGGSS